MLDTSGSMFGNRLTNAKEAARGMMARLSDGDTVRVVTYADAARMLVPTTRVSDTTRRVLPLPLDDVRANGSTCISCGLELAMRSVSPTPGTRATRLAAERR